MEAGNAGWARRGCVVVAAVVAGAAQAAPSMPGAHAQPSSGPPEAARDEAPRPARPGARVTWPWVAAQLVPSPQWTIPERGGVTFGARWQITPFLWSFGVRRGLSPFRFFVVEPNVRSWGSVEVFLSPEIGGGPGPFEHKLLGRAGGRLYAPLAHAGEYLSMSVGGSAFVTWEGVSGAVEIGLYTFAGMLGVQATHAPDPRARTTTLTLALRYF